MNDENALIYLHFCQQSCIVLGTDIRKFLSQSAAALSGSFPSAYRFKNLEMHKVLLLFSNLNLRLNLSQTALADLFRVSKIYKNIRIQRSLGALPRFALAEKENRRKALFHADFLGASDRGKAVQFRFTSL